MNVALRATEVLWGTLAGFFRHRILWKVQLKQNEERTKLYEINIIEDCYDNFATS